MFQPQASGELCKHKKQQGSECDEDEREEEPEEDPLLRSRSLHQWCLSCGMASNPHGGDRIYDQGSVSTSPKDRVQTWCQGRLNWFTRSRLKLEVLQKCCNKWKGVPLRGWQHSRSENLWNFNIWGSVNFREGIAWFMGWPGEAFLEKNKKWVQLCDIMKHNKTPRATGKNQLSKPLESLCQVFSDSQTASGAQTADLTRVDSVC